MSIEKSATSKAASNYATVRAEIEGERLSPWSSAPGFNIGPFVVNPMTLRSMVDLEISGNAFLTNNQMLEGDIGAYIWRHHPDYSPGESKEKDQFIATLSDCTEVAQVTMQIVEHQSAAFAETPEAISFSGGGSSKSLLPPIPAIASICHEYAAAYGVDPRDVADIDLRIVFQCCRAIRLASSDVRFAEPKKLREAKSQWLKSHGTN